MPTTTTTAAHATRQPRTFRVLAAAEVTLAAVAVTLDLAIPPLVILAVMVLSLLIHRQGLVRHGVSPCPPAVGLAATMLALAAAWTLLDVGLLKPIENHLTGTRQDKSQFASLRGSPTMLLMWVVLAWVVAALGETLAFIGFVQTRLTEVVGSSGVRPAIAVALSSLLFGLLHTEYGIVGVTISAINGAFYCVLRYRYKTLWAPIMPHGFIDTIGLVSFCLVGPVYGLWRYTMVRCRRPGRTDPITAAARCPSYSAWGSGSRDRGRLASCRRRPGHRT